MKVSVAKNTNAKDHQLKASSPLRSTTSVTRSTTTAQVSTPSTAVRGTRRSPASRPNIAGSSPWRASANTMREAPCTQLRYTAVTPVKAMMSTVRLPKPQALSAQNTAMPTSVMKMARGRWVRGALASSAAVDTTSNPQKPSTPTTIADQKPVSPCVALPGLKGPKLMPPASPALKKSMVADSASTTKVSMSIRRTVTLMDASAPRRQTKATGMVETTTPQ